MSNITSYRLCVCEARNTEWRHLAAHMPSKMA